MEPCHVLIIDDERVFQELIEQLLADEGYAVTTTDSVLGAAALVRRLQPHVILLDLGLPYRSGAALLGDLKADPSTAHIPVIIVSAVPETLQGDRRALAFAILTKGFELQLLLDTIRAACTSVPRGDSAEAHRELRAVEEA